MVFILLLLFLACGGGEQGPDAIGNATPQGGPPPSEGDAPPPDPDAEPPPEQEPSKLKPTDLSGYDATAAAVPEAAAVAEAMRVALAAGDARTAVELLSPALQAEEGAAMVEDLSGSVKLVLGPLHYVGAAEGKAGWLTDMTVSKEGEETSLRLLIVVAPRDGGGHAVVDLDAWLAAVDGAPAGPAPADQGAAPADGAAPVAPPAPPTPS